MSVRLLKKSVEERRLKELYTKQHGSKLNIICLCCGCKGFCLEICCKEERVHEKG